MGIILLGIIALVVFNLNKRKAPTPKNTEETPEKVDEQKIYQYYKKTYFFTKNEFYFYIHIRGTIRHIVCIIVGRLVLVVVVSVVVIGILNLIAGPCIVGDGIESVVVNNGGLSGIARIVIISAACILSGTIIPFRSSQRACRCPAFHLVPTHTTEQRSFINLRAAFLAGINIPLGRARTQRFRKLQRYLTTARTGEAVISRKGGCRKTSKNH